MHFDYMEMDIRGMPAFIRRDSAGALSSVDLFAFDCDGTLIDTEDLFLAAMIGTTEKLLADLHGRELPLGKSAKRMLSLLRQTGEYNSDWDSSFAMTCMVSMALAEYDGRSRDVPGEALMGRAAEIASEFAGSDSPKDVLSFRQYVKRQYSRYGKEDEFGRIMRYLSYPGEESLSPVCRIYGSWYQEAGSVDSAAKSFERMARKSRRLVDPSILESLLALTGGKKPAIITGSDRSFVEAALGPLSAYFDMEKSTFIGDLDASDKPNLELYSKPSPGSLERAVEGTGCSRLLYTGDSGEDLMMASSARGRGMEVLFAGVTARALDPEGFREHFMKNGADAVLSGVDQLVPLIESLRNAGSKENGGKSPP